MHPLLTRSLDRLIIRLAANAMPEPERHEPHAAEAATLLGHPDFFCDFVQSPSDFEFIIGNHFQFWSAISTPWSKNNLVRGRFFTCAEHWQNFSTVILLHGWNDEISYRWRLPFVAKRLARQQVNTILLELPYHLQRRPDSPGAINDFISEDLWRMVEATRQSIADTRATVKWLASAGCERIGLWGTSLGAWLTGLIISHEPQLNFAVLTTPVTQIERVINELAFCAPIRRSYVNSKVPLSSLNLASHRPKVPVANILIQEAEHDLFAPKEAIEDLWIAWNQPEIWRLRHGHISLLTSIPLMTRTVNWIAEKSRAETERTNS
ncbi:MAG: alpha/beta hydrolase family protein [Verrucomicrobiota bacterium]